MATTNVHSYAWFSMASKCTNGHDQLEQPIQTISDKENHISMINGYTSIIGLTFYLLILCANSKKIGALNCSISEIQRSTLQKFQLKL